MVTTGAEKAKNGLEKARIQPPALQSILDCSRIVSQGNVTCQAEILN